MIEAPRQINSNTSNHLNLKKMIVKIQTFLRFLCRSLFHRTEARAIDLEKEYGVVPLPTLHYFHATWCGPSKMMSKELNQNKIDAEVRWLDIDEIYYSHTPYARTVRSVPTFILEFDDICIARRSGYCTAQELNNWIADNIKIARL